VRFGPGLWPGPRRQARWVGIRSPGSRVGACAHRLGDATEGSALDAGGADPDNARQGGPGDCDLHPANRLAWREYDGLVLLVWRGIRGRYGEDRCGRWRGSRARQPPHPQGLRPKDASEAAAQRRRDPVTPAADDRSPRRSTHSRLLAPAYLTKLYRELATSGGRDGTGLYPRTVEYVHAVLRKAFRDAVVVDQILPSNPV
jgi:hypothetical protein